MNFYPYEAKKMTYLEPFKSFESHDSFEMLDSGKYNSNSALNEEIFSREPVFVLTEREAEAASPESMAVCGEEDPGEGLEFLVTDFIEKP
jgi:hypothetical protein